MDWNFIKEYFTKLHEVIVKFFKTVLTKSPKEIIDGDEQQPEA